MSSGQNRHVKIDTSMIRMKGDPPPELSEEEKREIDALIAQRTEMKEARLNVLDAWNALDNSLVELLRICIGTPDPIIASALYFTPHSFRTRLDTISKIISHIVISGMLDPALLVDWKKLSGKLGRRRDVRNWASHGHISFHLEANGKQQAILAPVMMQVDTYINAYRRGSRPGATVSEVKEAIKIAMRLDTEVRDFLARLGKARAMR